MITANDLKTKGIRCLEESLDNAPETIITVRGKEKYVVMKMDQYQYFRDMELEAALFESQQDIKSNKFTTDSVESHVEQIFKS